MTPLLDWEVRGHELGPTLDEWHAIVVTGADAHATAQVALGIGRVQAQHRRVAIGDLFGDTEPLQSLVETTDPHGLVDSFMYGISLNKIAYLVPDAGDLTHRMARAHADYREVAEPIAAAYPAIVRLGPHTRSGMVADMWGAAEREALGAAGLIQPGALARESCCLIYALPGCVECAGCPRLRTAPDASSADSPGSASANSSPP